VERADAAALNQIHRIAKVAPASLLHAALKDPLAGADSVDERRAFFDRVRDGLFEIDVFARSQAATAIGTCQWSGEPMNTASNCWSGLRESRVRRRQTLRSFFDGVAPRP